MRGLLLLCLLCLLWPVTAAATAIQLSVDLRDAPRHVYHVRETIPVASGTLLLRYPKWIPGDHSPTGPISDVVGLEMRGGGARLAWARDAEDMHALRVDVPEDVAAIEVAFDYLVPTSGDGFTDSPSTSAKLAVLLWHTVVVYPGAADAATLIVEPAVRLPAGWQAATALRVAQRGRDQLTYTPVPLETLIDAPLMAGAYYRAIGLATPPRAPEHVVHLVADGAAALAAKPDVVAAWSRLVAETHALFGAWHYRRYDFLVALSDAVAHYGLEHHESSENRMPERVLLDDDLARSWATLLPHELVHAWNGKYRRPAGLATRDYQRPMTGELLWVYEGLTEYWGEVLTARSGLRTIDDEREQLARIAARLAHTPGRAWRPLADTGVAAQLLYPARGEGFAYRRGTDFYEEGALLWLEVDALIRSRTDGARSLDDFARAFFGPPDTGPEVRPYTRADLVAALDVIAPFDWEAFFRRRVDAVRAGAPVEGIEAAGWTLGYDDVPNAMMAAAAADPESAGQDLRFSLGVLLSKEGDVVDLVPGSAAAVAGVPVGSKIVAVNARTYSKERMADALDAARSSHDAIELLVRSADFFTTLRLDYRDGERHPHLLRNGSKPDLLTAILAPRAAAAADGD